MTISAGSSQAYPIAIEFVDDRNLQIVWNDQQKRVYSFSELRIACPCATCREKKLADATKPRGLLPVLSAAEAAPLRILQMRPVGNYAYNIAFSDDHSSGIFTMELLRNLGREVTVPISSGGHQQ